MKMEDPEGQISGAGLRSVRPEEGVWVARSGEGPENVHGKGDGPTERGSTEP